MDILRIIKLKKPKVDYSSPVTFNKVLYKIIFNPNFNKKIHRRVSTGKNALTISPNVVAYIDNDTVWINSNFNYLGLYAGLDKYLTDKQIQNLVKKFNKKYAPCCDGIRLCKKCLPKARKLISF